MRDELQHLEGLVISRYQPSASMLRIAYMNLAFFKEIPVVILVVLVL
jgi:hypothetical protein